jgi:hypothetical protein
MTSLVSKTFILLIAAVSYRTHERQAFALELAEELHLQQEEEPLQMCPELYDPVYCTLNGTEFPSRCVALREGYARADCTAPKSQITSPNTAPAATEACPTPSPKRKWVVCAGMIFDNLCLASRNEFVPSTDCNSYWDDPVIRRHNQEARCATKPTRPIVCRRNSTTNSSSGVGDQNTDGKDSDPTEFENFCFARIDGYLRSDCDKKLDGGEA